MRRYPRYVAGAVWIAALACAPLTGVLPDGRPDGVPTSSAGAAATAPAGELPQPPAGASGAAPTSTPDPYGRPAGGRPLLNEVRFLPGPDQPRFVELKNGGQQPADLEGLALRNERNETVGFPPGLSTLAPEAVLLIGFDPEAEVAEDAISLQEPEFLSPVAGALELLGPQGELLDQVAWGAGQPGAVAMGRGGFHGEPSPGMTLGRPQSSYLVSRQEWLSWKPEQASPGLPNPWPAVEVLLPLSGAILAGPEVTLTWYPVPTAVSYVVEVSTDQAFAEVAIRESVESAPLVAGPLPEGAYFWRVTAVFPGGQMAAPSPSKSLQVSPAEGDVSRRGGLARPRSQLPGLQGEGRQLDVPMIYQQKDTRMLFLETREPEVRPGHPWNAAHDESDLDDPMDAGNCALASIAMINRYFGGGTSQDRLGYELLAAGSPGPEHDLMAGQGVTGFQVVDLMRFALDVEVTAVAPINAEQLEDLWAVIVSEIDADRPLKASVPGHSIVITGYRTTPTGERQVHVNDPSLGPYWTAFEGAGWQTYHPLKRTPTAPRNDEAEIALDSDGDGVVDFDETNRFGTNPFKEDTDEDGLRDDVDVAASVFLPGWGYGATGDLKSRDYDHDGLRMELDPDGDDGGCLDGIEDANLNGYYEWPEGETSNFEELDDQCWQLVVDYTFNDQYGHTVYTYVASFQVTEDGQIEGRGSARLDHDGACWIDQSYEAFLLEGRLVDPSPEPGDEVVVLIDFGTQGEEPEELAEGGDAGGGGSLPDGCTLGDVIGEGIAVDFANLPPAEIEVPLGPDGSGMATYETRSGFSARGPGTFVVRVERPDGP